MKVYSVIFYILSCLSIVSFDAYAHTPTYHLNTVFSNVQLRTQFSGFLDCVLQQVPTQKFYQFIDNIKDQYNHNPKTDIEYYQVIMHNISSIKPFFSLYTQLTSLYHQRTILADQAQKLLPKNKVINGVIEIGTPATYTNSLKSRVTIKGPIYSLNYQKNMAEAIQTFNPYALSSVMPYDYFVPLNDYAPIKEEDIPTESVDLVMCTIGLHHVEQEKLDAFINSIYRTLRPGGTFIVRDHNCANKELLALISTAHTVFNALIPGETVQAEMDEYRNFQPLDYWINLLEAHGFKASEQRLLQQGDPTANTMIAFTKVITPEQQTISAISTDLAKIDGYKRELMYSYLGSLEWLSVDLAQEYGDFVNHTPSYKFPYFKSIPSLWKVFFNQWKTAAKKQGNIAVLTSSYTLMNFFISVMTTVEFTAKGIISAPVNWVFSSEELGPIDLLIKDSASQIEFIDQRIVVTQTYPEQGLKLVKMPRFKEFITIIKQLTNTSVQLVEIAGQKEIQVKVRYKNESTSDAYRNIPGCVKEYDWIIPTQPNYTYAALSVQVSQLLNVIKQLTANNVEVLYLHDF